MKKILLLLAFLLFFSGTAAQAQTQTQPFCQNGSCTYTPLEPLPGLPNTYGPTSGSFPSLVNSAFKLLLGAGATIAVVMLILGALTYMFSDVVHNKTKAISRIRGAMWAIVLLVSSYLILNTINPDLVALKLNFSAINSPSQPSSSGSPLPITVNANSIVIHNGPNAYEEITKIKCDPPKTLDPESRGTDSKGEYTVWRCN